MKTSSCSPLAPWSSSSENTGTASSHRSTMMDDNSSSSTRRTLRKFYSTDLTLRTRDRVDESEFQYGPGFVTKLRTKFLHLTTEQKAESQAQKLRRVASLEHLLDTPGENEGRAGFVAAPQENVVLEDEGNTKSQSLEAIPRTDIAPTTRTDIIPPTAPPPKEDTCPVCGQSDENLPPPAVHTVQSIKQRYEPAAVPGKWQHCQTSVPRNPNNNTLRPSIDANVNSNNNNKPKLPSKPAQLVRQSPIKPIINNYNIRKESTMAKGGKKYDSDSDEDAAAVAGVSVKRVSISTVENIRAGGTTSVFNFKTPTKSYSAHLPPTTSNNKRGPASLLPAKQVGVIRPITKLEAANNLINAALDKSPTDGATGKEVIIIPKNELDPVPNLKSVKQDDKVLAAAQPVPVKAENRASVPPKTERKPQLGRLPSLPKIEQKTEVDKPKAEPSSAKPSLVKPQVTIVSAKASPPPKAEPVKPISAYLSRGDQNQKPALGKISPPKTAPPEPPLSSAKPQQKTLQEKPAQQKPVSENKVVLQNKEPAVPTHVPVQVSSPAVSVVPVVNRPTSAIAPKTASKWHQQQNNTLQFNFSNREFVPDYIENDGMDLSKRKAKVADTGVIRLGGVGGESGTDEEDLLLARLIVRPPSPCKVDFINANIIISGKSSLRQSSSNKSKGHLQFNDGATTTFEYPSERSLMLVEEYQGEVITEARRPDTGDDLVGNFRESSAMESADVGRSPSVGETSSRPLSPGMHQLAGLGNYTPSKLQMESVFELGVTRTVSMAPNQSAAKTGTTNGFAADESGDDCLTELETGESFTQAGANADLLF